MGATDSSPITSEQQELVTSAPLEMLWDRLVYTLPSVGFEMVSQDLYQGELQLTYKISATDAVLPVGPYVVYVQHAQGMTRIKWLDQSKQPLTQQQLQHLQQTLMPALNDTEHTKQSS